MPFDIKVIGQTNQYPFERRMMKLWQKDCFELNQVERSISTNVY